MHTSLMTTVDFTASLKRGDKGKEVKLLQEQLCFHEFITGLDGDFGPGTEAMVRAFRNANRLHGYHDIEASGIANAITRNCLNLPFARAIQTPAPMQTLGDTMLRSAFQHLRERPREIGGDNRGFWARHYLFGKRGLPWCAGFVFRLMEQACRAHGTPLPYSVTFSCDKLAAQAIAALNLYTPKDRGDSAIAAGSIFLLRKTETDWIHTGLVTGWHDGFFTTIEGNTNDGGSREGVKVCARIRRNLDRYDFIPLDSPKLIERPA